MEKRESKMKKKRNMGVFTTAGLLMCLGGGSVYAGNDNFDFQISGYTRTTIGVNLQDHQETSADDKLTLNMARQTLLLDMDLETGPLTWKAVTRVEKEYETDYLKRLNDLTSAQSPNGNSDNGDFMDAYNTDNLGEFIRELYFEYSITDNLDVRFGKQQLVWGESDFFQAMDLVHGFDFRGRLFYENNEEWRKPLILANFNYDIPDLNGNLNFYVRPGWDEDQDQGSNYNIEGGRWIPHPYRGVDFTAFTDAYKNDHDDGDWDDPTYGIRWTGRAGSVGYSLAALTTFNAAPIINPAINPNTLSPSVTADIFGVASSESYGEVAENGVLGDWIFPKISVFGASINDYFGSIDSTLSAELAYTPDKPFNYGELESSLPGWGGVIEKDTLSIMVRIDKELKLGRWLGTNRPSLSSIQLFDTWILGYDKSDDIVEFASFGSRKKEHTTYLTFFSLLNFKRDTINPSLVLGADLSNGGGFAIPAVEFVIGDNWRLKAEADLFWNDGDVKQVSALNPEISGVRANPLGVSEGSASFFDWFAQDNQVVFKITRQF